MIETEMVKMKLVDIFPNFAAQWESDQNLFREDNGAFTHHGVLAEFSHFIRDRFAEIPSGRLQQLFSQIEDWMTCGESDLENAVSTCFLENIAGDAISTQVRDYLGPKSIECFNNWDN